jgi:hypothetical protein
MPIVIGNCVPTGQVCFLCLLIRLNLGVFSTMLLTGRFKRRPWCLELERRKQAKSPRNKQGPLDPPCLDHRNLMTLGQAFYLRRQFIYLPPWRAHFDIGVSVRNQASGPDRMNAAIWAPGSDYSCRRASLPCYRRRLVRLRADGPTMFE